MKTDINHEQATTITNPGMNAFDTCSDETLLRMAMAGDEEAFTRLYRRLRGVVYRFARQMSGSSSGAEDVTQEVFLGHVLRDAGRPAHLPREPIDDAAQAPVKPGESLFVPSHRHPQQCLVTTSVECVHTRISYGCHA